MHYKLDLVNFRKIAYKYSLMRCFVKRKFEYCFFFLEDQTKYDSRVENEWIKKMVVKHSLFDNKKPWIGHLFEGLEDIYFGKTGNYQFFVDGEYRVGYESEDAYLQGKTIEDNLRFGGIRRLVVINNRTYLVAGGYRNILKHLGGDSWVAHSKELWPKNKKEFEQFQKANYGFNDLAGFSEDDMYAVRGKGDVFHYTGKIWEQIAFPSNMLIYTVCCGSDGWVYIGGQSGTVFKGRSNEWKALNKGSFTLEFRDMVWFQDRVYATSDYGFWEIVGDKIREVDVPKDIKVCSGHLSVGDGVMLLAGVNGIAVYDGKDWEVIADLIMMQRQVEIGR
jgi:hypothetical protein